MSSVKGFNKYSSSAWWTEFWSNQHLYLWVFCSYLPGFAGPRYDPEGHVVSHSILGNYDDFQNEAIKRGDLLVSHY